MNECPNKPWQNNFKRNSPFASSDSVTPLKRKRADAIYLFIIFFNLTAGIKLKRAKGIHETRRGRKKKKHARVKIYLPITEQLYQSHSSAVKRLNIICCCDLTIHLWLHWKSLFIITGADWRGSGHGGLFPRIQ